ncbi:MAG: ACT domain-containing protein [Clostridia bacterium]|nr:ACT domain-containing protein [Clostridia bacterium]
MSKAVVTVLGFDQKGIIARVADRLYKHSINILDISQTVVSGFFNMIMLVDISSPDCSFSVIKEELTQLGNDIGVQIRIQKNEIFEAMHHI